LTRTLNRLYTAKQHTDQPRIPDDANVTGILGRFTMMKGQYEFFDAAKICLNTSTS
jgi:hypothetical protein